jgi:hypothetical protein
MRIGVIRGDLPGPIHLQDLEVVSQYNPTTEPRGQERYIGRPTTVELEAVLANAVFGAGATIEGSDISGSFPLTITLGADDTLQVRTSATASYTTVVIAAAVYATFATFLVAVNAALNGTGVVARQGTGSGTRLALESLTRGVGSYLGVAAAATSTFNTPAGFGALALVRTMPSAAAFILALNPVAGVLDVSAATINGVGATTNANAIGLIPAARGTTTAIAEAIAPRIVETYTAIDSFLVGMISEYRSASYNPDSRRGLTNGAAISVVQDDGVTPYAPTLPVLTTADFNTPVPGAMTITGTGLGTYESKDTVVKVIGPTINKTLVQSTIEAAGGTIADTTIVIPASLLTGATLTTSTARVKVRQRVSSAVALT